MTSVTEARALALLVTRPEGVTSTGLTEVLGQRGSDVVKRLRYAGFQIDSEMLPGGICNYTLSTSTQSDDDSSSLGGPCGAPEAHRESPASGDNFPAPVERGARERIGAGSTSQLLGKSLGES